MSSYLANREHHRVVFPIRPQTCLGTTRLFVGTRCTYCSDCTGSEEDGRSIHAGDADHRDFDESRTDVCAALQCISTFPIAVLHLRRDSRSTLSKHRRSCSHSTARAVSAVSEFMRYKAQRYAYGLKRCRALVDVRKSCIDSEYVMMSESPSESVLYFERLTIVSRGGHGQAIYACII